MASELIRAFLALPLASAFQSDVYPLIERLKKTSSGVRWVEVSQIHVTLHFFGFIDPEEVPKISEIIRPITLANKPFHIYLKGLGAFPNLSRPRVIWMGIEGDTENLINVQRQIEIALKKNGYPTENRLFKAHLTLGRVKDGRRFSFPQIEFSPTAPRKIGEIVLFKSKLSQEGPLYEVIQTFPLSAA